jgi:hypothetical protein
MDLGQGGGRENTISGAARDGSGRDGRADVVFWGKEQIFVWEVKFTGTRTNKKEREMAPDQIDRYIAQLRLDPRAKGKKVTYGPPLPRISRIPSSIGAVDKWSEPKNKDARGIEFWAPSRPAGRKPVPATEPVLRPVTVPNLVMAPESRWSLPDWAVDGLVGVGVAAGATAAAGGAAALVGSSVLLGPILG